MTAADGEGVRLALERQLGSSRRSRCPAAAGGVAGVVRAARDGEGEIAGNEPCDRSRRLAATARSIRISEREVVALGDSAAVHAVDEQKKLRNMKASGPVDRIEDAAQRCCARRRSGAARAGSPARMSSGSPPSRAGTEMRCSVALVEPPALVEQPPLALQPPIQRRAGKRRQVVEGGDVEAWSMAKSAASSKASGVSPS